MKQPQNTDTSIERLSGSIERVTFHSEESGFCVLCTKVKGQRDLITVIGSAASITPGEYIECIGVWHNDRIQTIHRMRSQCLRDRTALCNSVRGLLAEYGIVLRKGVTTLRKSIHGLLEDAENGLRLATLQSQFQIAFGQYLFDGTMPKSIRQSQNVFQDRVQSPKLNGQPVNFLALAGVPNSPNASGPGAGTHRNLLSLGVKHA